MYILLFSLVIVLIAVVILKSQRLPGFFYERVYSFAVVEEPYIIPSDYQFSTNSAYYDIRNPHDQVLSSVLFLPSLLSDLSKRKPLIIWMRGNGAIIYRAEAIRRLQETNDVNVLLVNYRGSFTELRGDTSSKNWPTRARIASDNEVMWKFVCNHPVIGNFSDYFCYGLSLGTGIVTDFAVRRMQSCESKKLCGVILDNAFTSLSSAFVFSAKNAATQYPAIRYVPNLLLAGFCKTLLGSYGESYRNETAWKLPEMSCIRLLIFSSGLDEIVPPNDGKVIAEIPRCGPSTWVLVDDVQHGSASDREVFYEEIQNFIK